MTHAAALERLLGPHLTLDEWRDLPEDVPGELVESRLVEEEMPDPWHELIVAWLARILGNWADDAIVLGSETRFALSPTHGRKPDLTVYLGGRRPAEWLMCRLTSPSRWSRHLRATSAGIGKTRWWRTRRSAFRSTGSWTHNSGASRSTGARRPTPTPPVQAAGGIVQPVPGCPGLAIDLDAMWAKVDSLNG
jgi:hypothetical protein